MRRCLGGFVLVVAMLAGCDGGGSATPSPTPKVVVGVVDDCEHLAVRPRAILVACGDGAFRLKDLRFTSWTATSAAGEGTVVANDFTPNRALGHDHDYAAMVTLTEPLRTRIGAVFSVLTVHYRAASPNGEGTESWPLFVPGVVPSLFDSTPTPA